jgi:hypothetical protein
LSLHTHGSSKAADIRDKDIHSLIFAAFNSILWGASTFSIEPNTVGGNNTIVAADGVWQSGRAA